jgi:hypothetical protein
MLHFPFNEIRMEFEMEPRVLGEGSMEQERQGLEPLHQADQYELCC